MNKTACEIPSSTTPSEKIDQLLRDCKRIAIVGISPKESRDSNRVGRYLLEHGYDVIPVNPGQKTILGRPCYKDLLHIPFSVDMADLFLNPIRIPPFVDQAIEVGVRAVWMQIGVVHNEAAQKASENGIDVIMDRCIMKEHQRAAQALGPFCG